MVVYQLLDYGLPEDQERTLSPSLEGLIETLIELNSQRQVFSLVGCTYLIVTFKTLIAVLYIA